MNRTAAILAAAFALSIVPACEYRQQPCDDGVEANGSWNVSASGGSDTSGADASCVPFCNRLVFCGLVSSDNESACIDNCRNAYAANPAQTESGCSCVVNDFCRDPSGDTNPYQCPGAPLVTDQQLTTSSSGSIGTNGTTSSWGNNTDTTGGSTGGVTSGNTSAGTGGTIGSNANIGTGTSGTTSTGATTSTSGTTASTAGETSGTTGTTASTAGTTTGSTTGATTGSAGTCSSNSDCSLTQGCVNGVCLNRCNASCDCAANEVCSDDGYCQVQPPPQQTCDTDCDCPSGHTCVNNLCQ